MIKTLGSMLLLCLLAGSVIANPIGFDFITTDINFETFYPIMYNGSPVPCGKLIQIIRPATTNGPLHTPILTGTSLGMPGEGDILSCQFAIGEGVGDMDGMFALYLTGETATPINTQTATSLNAGTRFYIRVWADVDYNTAYPFPAGRYYADGGPFVVPTTDSSLYDIQVNPTSANPIWNRFIETRPSIHITEVNGTTLANPLNFGSSILGTPVTHVIRITYNGFLPAQLFDYSISGDFSISSVHGPFIGSMGYGYRDDTLTFTPTAIGTRTGTYSFSHNGSNIPNPYTINLSGTGLGIPPLIPLITEVDGGPIVSPLNFGSTIVGTSLTHTIRITNTGMAVLTLSSASTTGNFSCSTLASSITPGDHHDVTLTFSPTVADNCVGIFSFSHNGSGSPYTLNLTGTGLPIPDPNDLAITLTETINGDAVLSWSAVTGASSYRVYSAPDQTGPWTLIASTGINSYTDLNATSGIQKVYRVTAAN